MRKILFFSVLLLLAKSALAQGNHGSPMGGKNATIENLGGLISDSAFVLPWGDNPFRGKGLDTTGRVFIFPTDSLPMYMKKGISVKMLTGFDSNKTKGYIAWSQKAAPNGVASLGSTGKVPASQIEVVAISSVSVDTTVGQMLGHAGAGVGAVSVRVDSNRSYILYSLPSNNYANWINLTSAAVNSFNGRTGTIVPRSLDYKTDSVPEGVNNLYYTTARVANKMNFSDSAAMLLAYLRKGDTAAMLHDYARIINVAAWLALKMSYSDSAAMLAAYLRKGDTAAMLANYMRIGSGGSVSSVGLSMPSTVYNVSPGTITNTGVFGVTYKTQTANTIFAGPTSGAAAVPAFRALVAADVPDVSATYWKVGGNNISTEQVLGNNNPTPRVQLKAQNTLVGYLASAGLEVTNILGVGNSINFGKIAIGDPGTATPGFGGVQIYRNSAIAGRALDVNQNDITGNGAVQRWLSAAVPVDSILTDGSMWIGGGLRTEKSVTFNSQTGTVSFKSGANGKSGSGTLVSGTATISTTAVTANSMIVIIPTGQPTPPCASCGDIGIGTITAATSFVVNSSSATDSRTFKWIIFEQY